MTDLTNKQKAFIEEYFKDFNATRAAERAGYGGGYFTLAAIGSENLKKPKIAKRIDQRLQEAAMSADEVLDRLAQQARASIDDFVEIDPETDFGNWRINLRKARELGKLHLIKKLWVDANGRQRVEFHDPQRALELIGKHQGLFTERVDLDVTTGGKALDALFEQALSKVYGGDAGVVADEAGVEETQG